MAVERSMILLRADRQYVRIPLDVVALRASPRNNTCHNLLRYNDLPPGIKELLGLGLNYCVKPKSNREMITHGWI